MGTLTEQEHESVNELKRAVERGDVYGTSATCQEVLNIIARLTTPEAQGSVAVMGSGFVDSDGKTSITMIARAPEGVIYHASDCATNNAPAMEPGPCDCNAALAQAELERLTIPSSDAAPG